MEPFSFGELAKKWPSAVVARSQISQFTGGTLSPGYMANLDSAKTGPPRVRIGRRVVYPVNTLVEWMAARAEVLG